MTHQLPSPTDLYLIMARLTGPFMMRLASNWVYSLFAGPRHCGVVTPSAVLHSDG